jgi:hypothetical protein
LLFPPPSLDALVAAHDEDDGDGEQGQGGREHHVGDRNGRRVSARFGVVSGDCAARRRVGPFSATAQPIPPIRTDRNDARVSGR